VNGTPTDARAALIERWLAESEAVDYLEIGDDGLLASCNLCFAARRGAEPAELVGAALETLMVRRDAERVLDLLHSLDEGGFEAVLLNPLDRDGHPATVRCLIARQEHGLVVVAEPAEGPGGGEATALLALNNEISVLNRENARIARELAAAKGELERALEELQTSYWHLEKLQEVLPVCMECGRIKTGEARWDAVIDYLKRNRIFLSHGYCPQCAAAIARRYGLDEGADG